MQTTVPLCRDCHRAIHRLIPREKELGRNYHTIDLLLAHPEIGKFVRWVSKHGDNLGIVFGLRLGPKFL